MRQMMKGLVAAFAAVTASAAPAMACGGGLFTSCGSPCGYVSTCGGYGGGYSASYYGSYGYAGYGYGGGYAYQTVPAPQYYYVAQGPVYSGPGNLAPYPTYQEAAVSGYGNYYRGVSYPYDGGRYADATTHYYDGAPARPYYRPWRPRTSFYGYSRPRYNYGYAPRPNYAPRYSYGPRYSYAPRHNYRPILRRYY